MFRNTKIQRSIAETKTEKQPGFFARSSTLALTMLRRLRLGHQRYWRNTPDVVNPIAQPKILRSVAWVLLICFGSLTTSPTIAAIRQSSAQADQQKANAPSATDQYQQVLEDIRQAVQRQNSTGLQQNLQRLETANDAVFDELQAQQSIVARTKLPGAVEKHQQAIAQFKKKHQETRDGLQALYQETKGTPTGQWNEVKLKHWLKQLADYTPSRTPNKTDMKNLPWRAEKLAGREPKTTTADLQEWLKQQEQRRKDQTAQRQNQATLEGRSKDAKPTATAQDSMPQAIADGAAPTQADLAATIDAQITPEIQAKANQLGNPVAIYNWVRNNIKWMPTYGSAQGAQVTLDKLAGNATDTASLLVALYRAANIPARYVYGTIDLPIEKAKNWVGGTTGIDANDAALQIIRNGGIPAIGMVQGGTVKFIRMEHVWVEAYIPFYPGRGTKPQGTKVWIPLDPSDKDYELKAGMDLQGAVPIDAQDLLTASQQGATVNTTEGWVQNLSQASVQAKLSAYQTQLDTYINTNKSNATVDDVLGSQAIIVDNSSQLAGTLRNKIVAIGQKYSSLPVSLRHHFYYRLYADSYSRSMDSSFIEWDIALPSLAGKKVTLSFVPASPQDEQAVKNLIPMPALGQQLKPEDIPTFFPNSIRVKVQIKVEGELIQEGGSFGMGNALAGRGGFTNLELSGQDLTDDDTIIAGQQSAIGISAFGISARQISNLTKRIEETKATLAALQLSPSNSNLASQLTGELITGDILTTNIWSYFFALQNQGYIAGSQRKTFDMPGLSYGFIHVSGKAPKSFGIITTGLKMQGVNMDIGHLRHARWARNHSKDDWVSYNRMRGQYASSLEHGIPEMFFNDPKSTTKQEGISAVKAIQIAAAEGQKIYTITQATWSMVRSQLQHRASIIEEIDLAIQAGKDVTIHEKPINKFGWTGAGYQITDPATGAGAYMIEGAGNGGQLQFQGILSGIAGIGLGAAAAATLVLVAALAPIFAFAAGLLAGIAIVLFITVALYNLKVWSNTSCFWQGVGLGGTAVGAITGAALVAELMASVGTMIGAQSIRAMLANALSAVINTLGFGTVGAVTSSDPVQNCLGR